MLACYRAVLTWKRYDGRHKISTAPCRQYGTCSWTRSSHHGLHSGKERWTRNMDLKRKEMNKKHGLEKSREMNKNHGLCIRRGSKQLLTETLIISRISCLFLKFTADTFTLSRRSTPCSRRWWWWIITMCTLDMITMESCWVSSDWVQLHKTQWHHDQSPPATAECQKCPKES